MVVIVRWETFWKHFGPIFSELNEAGVALASAIFHSDSAFVQ